MFIFYPLLLMQKRIIQAFASLNVRIEKFIYRVRSYLSVTTFSYHHNSTMLTTSHLILYLVILLYNLCTVMD